MNHTNYELSKKIKNFLGESAPEPSASGFWVIKMGVPSVIFYTGAHSYKKEAPAYTLEDVLSKPFCEALSEARKVGGRIIDKFHEVRAEGYMYRLSDAYYDGGFPALELELERLIQEG